MQGGLEHFYQTGPNSLLKMKNKNKYSDAGCTLHIVVVNFAVEFKCCSTFPHCIQYRGEKRRNERRRKLILEFFKYQIQ